MTRRVIPKIDQTKFAPIQKGGIQSQLEKTGRLPPITIQITPLSGSSFILDRFLSYQFSSSILVPVDAFSFSFVAPDDTRPLNRIIKEGDLVSIYANGVALSRGIIDQTDVEVEASFGERVSITGRNLMSQLEDQDAVSVNGAPVWGNEMTIDQVMNTLLANTRIPGFLNRGASKKPWLFATEPGESKMSALHRYLEPLNVLAWVNENGSIVIGKPNMSQKVSGTLKISKTERTANVSSMKVVRSAALIPNLILPIWSGQEGVQNRLGAEQSVKNAARGPGRLRKLGHVLPKTVVVSTPQGASAQDLSSVNQLRVASGNLLQAYAKRELARANQKEMIVQVVVPGHYNEKGEKYHIDHLYRIIFDRGDVDEVMYLFQVEYSGGEDIGQKTVLWFCRLGTIVADVGVP